MDNIDNLMNGNNGFYSMPRWMLQAMDSPNMTVFLARSAPYKLTSIDTYLNLVPSANIIELEIN